jgi:hypothetical protein
MDETDDEAYRVTLVYADGDGTRRSETYGPYRKIAPARAKVTQAKNEEAERERWGYNSWRQLVSTRIQRARIEWEDVE